MEAPLDGLPLAILTYICLNALLVKKEKYIKRQIYKYRPSKKFKIHGKMKYFQPIRNKTHLWKVIYVERL